MITAVLAALVVATGVGLVAHGAWRSRAVGIIFAFSMLAVAWLAYLATTGHSTQEPLPSRFELLSAHVVEPGKASGGAGSIHLWVRDLLAENARPRAHRVPYDRALHLAVSEAMAGDASGRVGVVDGAGSKRRDQRPGGSGIRFDPASKAGLPAKRDAGQPRPPAGSR